MPASVTSATPDVNRARVKLELDYGGFQNVRVWRYVGSRPPVQVRNVKDAGTGSVFPPTYDYEAPLERSLGYAAVGWDDPDPEPPAPLKAQVTTGLDVAPTTTWLKVLGEPSLNRRLACVNVLPTRAFAGNTGLFRVLGAKYPVVVHDVMTSWTGTIIWTEPTAADYDTVEEIITSGTPLLLQTGSWFGSINEYISPQAFNSQHQVNARVPERAASLQFATVAYPVGEQLLRTDYTYTDLDTDYSTNLDVLGAFTNYYAVLRGDSQ